MVNTLSVPKQIFEGNEPIALVLFVFFQVHCDAVC